MADTMSPDHDFTEEDDERWLDPPERPLTPEEDFDAFFEAWQSGEEEREVCTTLARLAGTIETCPHCRSLHHLMEGTRRECRVCATQWHMPRHATNDEADGANTGLVSPARTTQHGQTAEQDI